MEDIILFILSHHNPFLSVHFAKSHGRKGTSADILVDINERDMMVEIAGIEVEEMLKSRRQPLTGCCVPVPLRRWPGNHTELSCATPLD